MDPATALGRGVANHLLAGEEWARERLRAHAGRTFTLGSGPLALRFAVSADGTLDAVVSSGAPTDLELYVGPLDVPALLADPGRWDEFVTTTGDAAFAATLKELAHTLPWFVERAFAKAFGPILGQRFADAGRRLLAFPDYAGSRFAESVASYARDEAGVLARGDEARAFARDNVELAHRVEAIAERVSRLENK